MSSTEPSVTWTCDRCGRTKTVVIDPRSADHEYPENWRVARILKSRDLCGPCSLAVDRFADEGPLVPTLDEGR
jgi:hypothetical protein